MPGSPTQFGFTGSVQALSEPTGIVAVFTPAVALLVGDAVLVSAANTVTKNLTAGDQVKRIGIVVGGDLTGMQACWESGMVGKNAATATTGKAIVCIAGVAYGIADAIIAAMSQVKLGATTAGRLAAATPTTDAGKIVGFILTASAAAGDPVKVAVSPA